MTSTYNHLLVLDKPPGMSSARAVDRVKRLLPRGTKIGHAGTLDPFATGVLLLLVGKATKLCEQLMDQPKQYEGTVKLGATTATDDLESPEQPFAPIRGTGASPVQENEDQHGRGARATSAQATSAQATSAHATSEEILALLPQFIGPIQQQPPTFSALKVKGRRAYDLARRGHDVHLPPRTVHIYGIELLHYAWPLLQLRIDCGRGTYIRALARDIGAALGVGGYLTELRRTRIGPHTLARAVTLDQLHHDGLAPHLRPTA